VDYVAKELGVVLCEDPEDAAGLLADVWDVVEDVMEGLPESACKGFVERDGVLYAADEDDKETTATDAMDPDDIIAEVQHQCNARMQGKLRRSKYADSSDSDEACQDADTGFQRYCEMSGTPGLEDESTQWSTSRKQQGIQTPSSAEEQGIQTPSSAEEQGIQAPPSAEEQGIQTLSSAEEQGIQTPSSAEEHEIQISPSAEEQEIQTRSNDEEQRAKIPEAEQEKQFKAAPAGAWRPQAAPTDGQSPEAASRCCDAVGPLSQKSRNQFRKALQQIIDKTWQELNSSFSKQLRELAQRFSQRFRNEVAQLKREENPSMTLAKQRKLHRQVWRDAAMPLQWQAQETFVTGRNKMYCLHREQGSVADHLQVCVGYSRSTSGEVPPAECHGDGGESPGL